MQLHELKSTHKKKFKKRVGRGGKRGTYSGRGVKGQKSRAGRRIRPAVRDLILRLPKHRGFRNKPLAEKSFILNLKELELKLETAAGKNQVIDRDFLKEIGILPVNYRGPVKLLGGGGIKKSVDVKGLLVSKSARNKIEKAGGKIE